MEAAAAQKPKLNEKLPAQKGGERLRSLLVQFQAATEPDKIEALRRAVTREFYHGPLV